MNIKHIINRIRLFTLKKKEPYLSLYNMLGFYPNNIKLYEQAFMHRSITMPQYDKNGNNERLEFLGDAILDAIIADIVYKHFPDKREGFLTNTRAKIVQRENLNRMAVSLGVNKQVSSKSYVAKHHKYVYGNALEALIGAIYLDQGYRRCRKFVEERIINRHISLDKLARQEVNFKSRLIEWTQKNRIQIDFDLIETVIDRDHTLFKTSVSLEGTHIATGVGNTKKESQQQAAKKIINKINKDPKGFMQIIDDNQRKRLSEMTAETMPETFKTPNARTF